MRRKFVNHDLPLPDGTMARIGTHMSKDGQVTVKLRLPSDFWAVTWLGRAKESGGFNSGKTVITLDRREP